MWVVERPPNLMTDKAGLAHIKGTGKSKSGELPQTALWTQKQTAWHSYAILDNLQGLLSDVTWTVHFKDEKNLIDLQDSICVKITKFHNQSFIVLNSFPWGQFFSRPHRLGRLVAECNFSVSSSS